MNKEAVALLTPAGRLSALVQCSSKEEQRKYADRTRFVVNRLELLALNYR